MTTSPVQDQAFDFIVIGAGPVGETFAQLLTEAGHSVAIVEHRLVGGDCAYYACKPSKALLRPVQVAQISKHLQGVQSADVISDELLARRTKQVGHYDDTAQLDALEKAGLTVIRGHGKLAGKRRVSIHGSDHNTREFTAHNGVVITSGTTPNIPGPFRGIPVWDSKDATAVQDIPPRLIVVGGGAVACEAATWMTGLGSDVTMLVRDGSLLAGFEPFVSEIMTDQLTELGVSIEFFTEVNQVSRPEGVEHGLGLIKGGQLSVWTNTTAHYEADELLLATGRRPDLDDVGLDTVGLTNEVVLEGRTPDWLYALGDASGQHQLTHMGKYQAGLLAEHLREPGAALDTPQAPTTQVVFTDPQVASVGLTEDAARKAGYTVRTGEAEFAKVVGAALLRDDVTGRAKIVVDQATQCLIGATLVGPETAEMLHAATIAIVGKVPVSTLRHAVPVFPTASEIWLELLKRVDLS